MGKRGPKPKGQVKIKWSANFAYAIGLIVTDGCLYNDGRHINLTTKDLEQAENFQKCLGINVKYGRKGSGLSKEKAYYNIQFSDVIFYKFLESIGITQAKSKTVSAINIPDIFFFDFLRGSFDGDGCFYSYWDKRWKSSYMFYLEFVSASERHVVWLREQINSRLDIDGHVTGGTGKHIYQLKYAKKHALEIIKKMYYNPKVICLSRKKLKIKKALRVENKQQKIYSTK